MTVFVLAGFLTVFSLLDFKKSLVSRIGNGVLMVGTGLSASLSLLDVGLPITRLACVNF